MRLRRGSTSRSMELTVLVDLSRLRIVTQMAARFDLFRHALPQEVKRNVIMARKKPASDDPLDEDIDFSNGWRRGPIIPHDGKTRITMWVDTATLEWFREWSERHSRGYQTLMNQALREFTQKDQRPLPDVLREIVRSEVRAALKK